MPRHLLLLGLMLLAPGAVAADGVPSFRNEVMPLLSRGGCNSGPCHGNLNGKGGFRLSLRGDDPVADLATITRESLGRRVSSKNPDQSLILLKASGAVPHEGGVRFGKSSEEYAILRNWIAQDCPNDSPNQIQPTRLFVRPPSQVAVDPVDRIQLDVEVEFSNGERRRINHLATFEPTSVGIAQVLPTGEVIREQPGELIVLVRYNSLQVPVRIAFLPRRSVQEYQFQAKHPIDEAALAQWKQLRLQPASPSRDEVFLRRIYLDILGQLPTSFEARRFLESSSPNKRQQLIDELLHRDEFANYWAQKWSDLLRNEERTLDRKGVQIFFRWIKGWIADDKPLNEFAREILAARGSTYTNPATNFYRAIRDPYQRAESVAQVFLGLRISCARCHNHPFDRWTQDDYHRFAGLFARIDYRVLENKRRDDLDKHEFSGEQIVLNKALGELPHPRGGTAWPRLLGEAEGLPPDQDRLSALADWVSHVENPFFAPAQVNRVWFHLFGRGLVDPNDDFRSTNPPSNPDLLNLLVREFQRGGFRLKPLLRYILSSQVYQLDSRPHPANPGEEVNLAQARIQPLQAEQLLSGISKALGVPVKFPGYPAGVAVQELPAMPLAGGRRGAESRGMRFLKVFGKPERLLTCECERSEDPGMLQAFQLMTGELLQTMLKTPSNTIGQHLSRNTPPAEMLGEFYLATLTRLPTEAEQTKILHYIDTAASKRAAWEDVVWALVNSKEFLLRR